MLNIDHGWCWRMSWISHLGWFIWSSRHYELQRSPPLLCRFGLGFHYDDWYSPSFHKKHAGFLILLSISRLAVHYWQLMPSRLWDLAIRYISTISENSLQREWFSPPVLVAMYVLDLDLLRELWRFFKMINWPMKAYRNFLNKVMNRKRQERQSEV